MTLLYGGIEAGGTKFVCAVGTGPDDLQMTRFPTTTPAETYGQAIEFFRPYARRGELAAVGIASFGPVDPNPASPTFGYITTTPKAGWAHSDFVGTIKRALDVPVGFDTDVNVAQDFVTADQFQPPVLTAQGTTHMGTAIHTALDHGINFFDHADIYTEGQAEEVFATIWQDAPRLREKIYLQTKCGTRGSGSHQTGLRDPPHRAGINRWLMDKTGI